jgi:hypothetical protein
MQTKVCCGMPMNYHEVFGIRIYVCAHRSHHPVLYLNLNTGECVSDEELEWHEG